HLVATPRHEVGVGRERAVGRQLGGVDEHGNASSVGGLDDGFDGGHPAGDVGRAGDCEKLRPWACVQRDDHIVGCEGAVGAALDVAAGGGTGPGEQVGVVLDDGGHDDIIRLEAQAIGQV